MKNKTIPVNKAEPELFVFDICDTLFYSNTTFDFIRFVLEKKKWMGKIMQFNIFTKKESPIFICLYLLQRITHLDWSKKWCLGLLKGLSKVELYTLGQEFEQSFLASRIIEKTHQMVTHLRAEGKKVVLISASIDPVVSAIANKLEVDYRCSELDYEAKGCFTGNLRFEMTSKKLIKLREMLSGKDAPFAVATDNFSDRSLVEAACQRHIIIYNDKAMRFWQDLDAEFIKVSS